MTVLVRLGADFIIVGDTGADVEAGQAFAVADFADGAFDAPAGHRYVIERRTIQQRRRTQAALLGDSAIADNLVHRCGIEAGSIEDKQYSRHNAGAVQPQPNETLRAGPLDAESAVLVRHGLGAFLIAWQQHRLRRFLRFLS